MRGATDLILQHHQMLRMPRKMSLMIDVGATDKLEQLEVVYQQWGSGIPKKHLIQLILIILSCC